MYRNILAYKESRRGRQASCSTTLPYSLKIGAPSLPVELDWSQRVSAWDSAGFQVWHCHTQRFHLGADDFPKLLEALVLLICKMSRIMIPVSMTLWELNPTECGIRIESCLEGSEYSVCLSWLWHTWFSHLTAHEREAQVLPWAFGSVDCFHIYYVKP